MVVPRSGAVAPKLPSLTAVNVIIIVLSFSGVVSPVTVRLILAVVVPAAIVILPLSSVASYPAGAV